MRSSETFDPRIEIAGFSVPRLGFGALALTGQPGGFGPFPDTDHATSVLRRAYELGIRFVDTALAYGPGFNEELIARAFSKWPSDLLVATKVGVEKRSPTDARPVGHPKALVRQVRESAGRLKRDSLDLVYLHLPDPKVPLEDSIGALQSLRHDGLISHVGLSNVSRAQIESVLSLGPVAAVQNRYSFTHRADDLIIDELARRGIAYVPYGPLGNEPDNAPPEKRRALNHTAERLGATPSQTALAWLLRRSNNVIPIPGTSSLEHLEQNVSATALALDASAAIELDALR